MSKIKIKVNYTKLPSFDEFLNKKSIEHEYYCCNTIFKRRIFIESHLLKYPTIKVVYESLVECGYNKYGFKKSGEKEFPLTSKGYLKLQLYIHKKEFGEKCALEQVTNDVIQETYKLFDEYDEKIKALEEKENGKNN